MRASVKNTRIGKHPKWTIDIVPLLLQLVTLVVLLIIGMNNRESQDFPTLYSDSMQFIIFIIAGIALQITASLLAEKKVDVINYLKSLTPDDQMKFMLVFIAGLFALGIEEVTMFVAGERVIATTAIEIYAFFAAAAVAEESLFRGGITSLGMAATDQQANYWVRGLLLSLMISLIFALAHAAYWGNFFFLLSTFLVGMICSITFLATRNLIIPMVLHMMLNVLASGTLVQTLQMSGAIT